MNGSIPIIKIEIESMRQSIVHAFRNQLLGIDEQFKLALDEACQPEKIQKLLTDSANSAIKEAIEEEVRHFFEKGNGRKLVAEKVREKLELNLK